MAKAWFVDPMLLLKTDSLPCRDAWQYQLNVDGYRALAFKNGGKLYLRSRNNKDFAALYPNVLSGLSNLPADTILDGEIVALDEDGKPSFNVLQNYGSAPAPVLYYVFDVLMLAAKDVTRQTL